MNFQHARYNITVYRLLRLGLTQCFLQHTCRSHKLAYKNWQCSKRFSFARISRLPSRIITTYTKRPTKYLQYYYFAYLGRSTAEGKISKGGWAYNSSNSSFHSKTFTITTSHSQFWTRTCCQTAANQNDNQILSRHCGVWNHVHLLSLQF